MPRFAPKSRVKREQPGRVPDVPTTKAEIFAALCAEAEACFGQDTWTHKAAAEGRAWDASQIAPSPYLSEETWHAMLVECPHCVAGVNDADRRYEVDYTSMVAARQQAALLVEIVEEELMASLLDEDEDVGVPEDHVRAWIAEIIRRET
jgi:hypothetical protein